MITTANLLALDIAYLGTPFVNVEAKLLSTGSLDVAYLGTPFTGDITTQINLVDISILTTKPTIALNTSGLATTNVAFTTISPTITLNASGLATTTVAFTTIQPTIALNASGLATAMVAFTTTNPTIALNASGLATTDVAFTTIQPTIALNASGLATTDVTLTTTNPTITLNASGLATTDVAFTTTNPTITLNASGLARVDISLTTQKPTIIIDTILFNSVDVLLTTTPPIVAISVSSIANTSVILTTLKPRITISTSGFVVPPYVPPPTVISIPNRPNCVTPSNWTNCRPWDLTEQPKTDNLADSYIQESLAIAGAKINVHKLLGVHEQTRLLDLTGNGNAISGGDAYNYPASNAFDKLTTEWYSRQSKALLLESGYIGYDFGIIRLPNGRQRYGVDASIRKEITTIKIKQSVNSGSRVTKARVERSDDGRQWYGVAVIDLPNNDTLNTINFKNSAPCRYWRLRPITFVGDECNSWGIQALEMHEYDVTTILNIQDKILMENRDRDYDQSPLLIKGYYELVQANLELKAFGMETQISYNIKLSFNTCVNTIGRPVIIGDIIELPSETQYTPDLRPIKRYLEVTDVTWDPTSYTPGWMPTMLLITALPALASQETQDIFGDLVAKKDNSGLFDKNDGNNLLWQDYSNIDQTIKAKSLDNVPEKGSEGSNTIREYSDEESASLVPYGLVSLENTGFVRNGLYVEDAMPQNDAPYTEADTFPANPHNGDYHRLIYVGLAKDVPARLYRYSVAKSRWVYLETDRRAEFNGQKPILDEYTTSRYKKPARDIK